MIVKENTEKPPVQVLCNNCFTPNRPAKLVIQEVVGPCCIGKVIFRYYLCQWCLAAKNRRAEKEGRSKLQPIVYKPDAEVWKEHNIPTHLPSETTKEDDCEKTN